MTADEPRCVRCGRPAPPGDPVGLNTFATRGGSVHFCPYDQACNDYASKIAASELALERWRGDD